MLTSPQDVRQNTPALNYDYSYHCNFLSEVILLTIGNSKNFAYHLAYCCFLPEFCLLLLFA